MVMMMTSRGTWCISLCHVGGCSGVVWCDAVRCVVLCGAVKKAMYGVVR